jgi:hypothetical protein
MGQLFRWITPSKHVIPGITALSFHVRQAFRWITPLKQVIPEITVPSFHLWGGYFGEILRSLGVTLLKNILR